MIETHELTKIYRMGDETVRALDDVSIRIEDGESVAILGPSGSGKSTLMHLIGGLDTPTSGSIDAFGHDLSSLSKAELATYRNASVGFVFQSFHLQSHLTAVENVELPLKIRGVPRKERRRIASETLEHVGLADRMLHRPTELSGGQRQRVSIARALSGNPRFLLADEPTGNLDSKTGDDIIEFFLRLNRERGLTLVVVTHNVDVGERLGRSIRLRDGKVVGAESAAKAVVVPVAGDLAAAAAAAPAAVGGV